MFSLDAWKPEDGYSPEPTHELTPERLFERQWAEVVLARTLDRLEAEHTGQAMRFEELKTFLLDAKGAAPVAAVAARLGVSESALKSVVHRMRRRYAQLFRGNCSGRFHALRQEGMAVESEPEVFEDGQAMFAEG